MKFLLIGLSVFISLNITLFAQQQEIPFEVKPLFDLNNPNTLGLSFLKDAETITIFSPTENDNKYNHGVVLYPFKNKLYAMWQSSSVDEDGADTQVFYSRSIDGENWSKPISLTPKFPDRITTSGGWWSDGQTLVAYTNVWLNKTEPKGGHTEYLASKDGLSWKLPKQVKDKEGKPVNGIIEQDVHSLPNGRLLTAFHLQPGLKATPFFTDDRLGIKGWIAGKMENLPSEPNMSREIEPSWFYRKDGAIVMIFRDQQSTFKKLASVSKDNGKTWTKPVLIDTPDSRAKQSAGNLLDGTAFMVNNPSGNRNRFPLVITLSKDGFLFDKAYLLRSGGDDLQKMQVEGKFKRAGYSYPKSVIWGDFLYVSYSTNKEDVELTRIPLSSLK